MKARPDLDGRYADREHDGDLGAARRAPGKVTLTSQLSASRDVEFGGLMPVQLHAATAAPGPQAHEDPFALHLIASRGVAGGGAPLPYLAELKPSFGRHAGVLDGATAHVGGDAAEAATQIGAQAFTTGNRIGFSSAPDRALAGHEAAHLVQQAGGVQLEGGVGEAGDPYERHADEVGAAFARGESVEALLDEHVGAGDGRGAAGIQRKETAPGDGSRTLEQTTYQLWKKAMQVRQVAGKLEKLGERLLVLGTPLLGEKKYLEASRRVQAVAKGVIDVYKGCLDLTGSVNDAVTNAGKLVDQAGKLIDAVDLIGDLFDDGPLDAFLADPQNDALAEQWAVHTAGIFTKAAGFIPDDIPGIPSFILKMWKGLLSAPANYVNAFLNVMKAYKKRVAEKSGFDGYGGATYHDLGAVQWRGPLARLYRDAPEDLKTFMKDLRDRERQVDPDFKDDDASKACAALIREIVKRHGAPGAWIELVNRHLAAANQEQAQRIDDAQP